MQRCRGLYGTPANLDLGIRHHLTHRVHGAADPDDTSNCKPPYLAPHLAIVGPTLHLLLHRAHLEFSSILKCERQIRFFSRATHHRITCHSSNHLYTGNVQMLFEGNCSKMWNAEFRSRWNQWWSSRWPWPASAIARYRVLCCICICKQLSFKVSCKKRL